MSTYTPSLGLEKITPGSQAGLWGNTTNNSLDLIDQAVTGVTPLSFASASGATIVLTDDNGAPNQARSSVLNITGSATGPNTVIIPNKQKTYFVRNGTGADIVFQTPLATTPCTVGSGYNLPIFCDGYNNVYLAILAPGTGTLTVTGGGTGQTTFAAGFIKSPGGTTALTSAEKVNAATELSGATPVANGGTGLTSLTNNSVLLVNSAGAVTPTVGGTSGNVLTWNGTNWVSQAPASGAVSSVTGSTGITVSPTSGNVVVSINTSTMPTLAANNTWTGTQTFNSSASNAFQFGGSGPYTHTIIGQGFTTNSPNATISSSSATLSIGASSSLSAGTMTLPGLVVSGTATCNAWNMAATTSMYWNGSAIVWAINNNTVQYVDFNGNIRIYGTSAGKSGGGTWYDSSDARLKENIQPLTGALEKLSALNPVTYEWKYDRQDVSNVGFIAQEVEDIFPLAVSETEPSEQEKPFIPEGGKVKNIGWQNDMTAYLIGAIKELKAEIDALKAAK